jgi:Ig-like domain-containing protein
MKLSLLCGSLLVILNAQLIASAQPTILQQPENCTVSPYGSAAFCALAAGTPAPAYQWTFNGTPLPGETANILLVHNIQTNVAGGYKVIASNSGGAIQSATAWLTVRDTNPVPVITMLGPTNGSRVFFIVQGEPGRHYRSETTYDLNEWSLGGPIYQYGQATNTRTVFSTYLLSPDVQFVAVSLDTPTDACIAQLRAMDTALAFFAIEHNLLPAAAYTLQDLAPYFRGGTIPTCPGHGMYAPGAVVTNGVSCSLGVPYGQYDGGHHWP